MSDETTEETGLIVPAVRSKQGRWLPGVSGNPSGASKTRAQAGKAVIDAIANGVDPTHVADTINRLLFADSYRANYLGAKLYLDQIAGLPVQRKEEAEEVYVTLLERLRESARLRAADSAGAIKSE